MGKKLSEKQLAIRKQKRIEAIRKKREDKKFEKLAKEERLKEEIKQYKTVPKSFVIKRGKLGMTGKRLVKEMRRVMMPYTAVHLKERKNQKMKDIKNAAIAMCVNNLIFFKIATTGLTMKIAKVKGLSLTFKVERYSILRDLVKSGLNPYTHMDVFRHSPLVVLSGFTEEKEHVKIMADTFNSLFPSVKANSEAMKQCKRVLLFHYVKSEDIVIMRQYAIHTRNPENTGFGILKSQMKDDSQALELPIDLNGNLNVSKKKILLKLQECGPRLELKLLTIKDGLFGKNFIYRLYSGTNNIVINIGNEQIEITKEEIEEMKKRILQERKEEQEKLNEKEERFKLKGEKKKAKQMYRKMLKEQLKQEGMNGNEDIEFEEEEEEEDYDDENENDDVDMMDKYNDDDDDEDEDYDDNDDMEIEEDENNEEDEEEDDDDDDDDDME